MTVTFEEHNGETTLTIRNRVESIAYRDTMQQMGWSEGSAESLARLEEHLAKA
jgi:hypothetical protein